MLMRYALFGNVRAELREIPTGKITRYLQSYCNVNCRWSTPEHPWVVTGGHMKVIYYVTCSFSTRISILGTRWFGLQVVSSKCTHGYWSRCLWAFPEATCRLLGKVPTGLWLNDPQVVWRKDLQVLSQSPCPIIVPWERDGTMDSKTVGLGAEDIDVWAAGSLALEITWKLRS